ncbi:MAG: metal-dependent hydrolase [Burkholderiales bacterium]|nr:metal-dependent hydrolase [Anaerolineae bacterium]
MGVTVKWLGHSTFALDVDGHPVLFDPYLTNNPLAAAAADELDAEMICVSHAHGDHTGDVISIAKRTNALVICNFEMANYFEAKGVKHTHGMNPGGKHSFEFATLKWTIAHHSSSFPDGTYGGQPNGFVFMAHESGKNIYFAGDTSLFLDMQLIGKMGIDLAMLPIGDNFTMGPEDSLEAIGYVRPKYVMPMHYNTWEPIAQDGGAWANQVSNETSATPIVLDPGGTFTLE